MKPFGDVFGNVLLAIHGKLRIWPLWVALPLDVPQVLNVATHVADLVSEESSIKKDLFELEKKFKDFLQTRAENKNKDKKESQKGQGAAEEESDEDSEQCAICLERLSSNDLCTLPCSHAFHAHCISTLVQRRSTSLALACPLCRKPTNSEGLERGASANPNRCLSLHCGFLRHSHPLPEDFTAGDENYCCSLCRLQPGGQRHGGNCERVVDLPTEIDEDADANKEEEKQDEAIVNEWVKLFMPLLKVRETRQMATNQLNEMGISIDDAFSVKVAKCLLKNVTSNMFELEAIELLRKNGFSLLFK
mmetsp:Transcript_11023/g.14337  ORF Transcript_11023/g.14337 Transcript_11023/m.14337 type:complete len:305 (-) Transcript_11023:160-1074(-)|eukprot:CAMPEP_0114366710 /NCGR_PEP_ID=MMETSP0101-20121206/29489_1 /TAXON_ID=38822 ORGANISM="Pteridomonas danica, Strain PT" /NCGR_SAMPLE_ID=MMETSP0101 /ASSEMBLY_ACC=CAM_ASM_000211 /LENGTH=304 /DNA_ID=CAMNT_0001515925 /DNA_START=83 /DNA_END=997 /DNA_ORIENTATION=+